MPKRKRSRISGALEVVRQARNAAKKALDSLRTEIAGTRDRLEKLLAEERSFRLDLFGGPRAGRAAPATGRPGRRGRAGARPRAAARRKGPPQAERYFARLPDRFSLDDVRKLAGRTAGISLAQWSRAKRIRKTGSGYQKVK